MRRFLVIFPAFAFVLILFANIGAAQTQFGTISGRVTDPNGLVVPGAQITLTSLATNIQTKTQTNTEGLYVLANVAAGQYDLAVEKQGFAKEVRRFSIAVAERNTADFTLRVGAVAETIEVTAPREAINTVSGELSSQITARELADLPTLTRDPYSLLGLAAGAVDAGSVTGDTRGYGLAIAGARTSSVNYMLDGGENNDSFVAGVGQSVPLDSVQEFRVQSDNNTAEFGRNPVVTNVVTKSGSNAFHGSAYEYYRGAALTTQTYQDKALGQPKANFVRNQFGGSLGGPIKKDKTFFFGSIEGTRVRSYTNAFYYVPTADWMASASPASQAFVNAFGGPPTANSGSQITARDIVEYMEGAGAGTYASNPLLNANPASPNFGQVIPASTPMFGLTSLRRAFDGGGGTPENGWMWTTRVDHHFNDNTALLMRYAFSKDNWFAGTNSFSPYGDSFNTGTDQQNQNANATLTHTFSPTLFNETRLVYNRLNQLQPLGKAPATTPCWYYDYGTNTSPFGGYAITFPGYVPDVCVFAGIPYGGPQNVYQFAQNWTLSKGKHTFKWGGQFVHMRDNRSFGAYENAFFDSFSMQGMLNGSVDYMLAAIDPRGKVPGDSYNTATDGAFQFPDFTRHFHYNELAFYGEDSFKLHPRFTLTMGLRWEYFGVLHSPDNERYLDANLYFNQVGNVTPDKTIYEAIRDARFRRSNHLYASDYGDFGPRIGFAWDVFGDAKTVFRGGYGIYYDRNFGNAVFNVIQNPPNYMTVTLFSPESGPNPYLINPNQFQTLAPGGVIDPLSSSARALNPDMKTAYTEQWNATLEHDIMGKGLVVSASYIGSNGYRLYSLSNLNFRGSCLMAPPGALDTCGTGSISSRLNQTGLTGMNLRGNDGMSRYNGLELGFRTRELHGTGLNLFANYTYSHSIDNESSFFADSSFESDFGFGFRNPFQPGLDRASSTNDIRHRFSTAIVWEVPWGKGLTGVAGQVLGGWNFTGTITAQTGGAFSVYDGGATDTAGNRINNCSYDATNFCYPIQVGATPQVSVAPIADAPNSFSYYNLGNSYMTVADYCSANGNTVGGVNWGSALMCGQGIQAFMPQLMAPRNQFRTPGMYDTTFAVLKNFKLPWREETKLQFRAEFYNLLNHSNLYVQPDTNVYTGAGSEILAKRGVPACSVFGCPDERRNIQLALRFTF